MVNAGYYEEIPKAAYRIDDTDGPAGLQERKVRIDGETYKYGLWSRQAYQEFPPILWTYHPQGKREEYLAEAASLVQEVAGW